MAETRGLNNWKNLFKKPNPTDIIIFIGLIFLIILAYFYNRDISDCRQVISALNKDTACSICSNSLGVDNLGMENISNPFDQIHINETIILAPP